MLEPVYLDYNATTPIAPEVLEAMVPALREQWGNPSSAHALGRAARHAVDRAREEVAALIGCRPQEVIFTSGGTEADNAAVIGVAEACQSRGRHIVISAIEHAAVDQACGYLEGRGFTVTRVGVDSDGRVDPDRIEAAFRADTTLLSLMHANNETGVIQPVADCARRARRRSILVHSDTAQSVGKLPVHLDDLEVDLLVIAGHKLYAPKGVGALVVREGVAWNGFLRGAGHEGGRRAGTENTPGIVGLGAACTLARFEEATRPQHLRLLRDRLEFHLRAYASDAHVHGGRVERLPNTLSIALPGLPADAWLREIEGVATAGGAACHSGQLQPSPVLLAMGVPAELAVCTLRLTVGRPTTVDQIDLAAERLVAAARRARQAAG